MNGNLNQISFPDIIHDLHLRHCTGLLRIVQDKTLRAIFIENGNLVFALSNVPDEQLGELLLRENRISQSQYNQAQANQNSKQRLGKVLIETGVLTAQDCEKYVKKQIIEIISANFNSHSGEFSFEENTKASHEVKLGLLTPNIILTGVRMLNNDEFISNLLGPISQIVEMSSEASLQLLSATLDSTDGFLLSRISEPISIDDLVLMTGIPRNNVMKSTLGLICAGILISNHPRKTLLDDLNSVSVISPVRTIEENKNPSISTEQSSLNPESVEPSEDEVREELRGILYTHNLRSATHYTVLGIESTAQESEIKKAYYQLAKKYHPDRFRQYSNAEISANSEFIFKRISTAYENLKGPESKSSYDKFLGPAFVNKKNENSPPSHSDIGTAPKGATFKNFSPPQATIPIPPVHKSRTEEENKNIQEQSVSAEEKIRSNNQEIAQRNYNYGRAALEEKDFLEAAKYLREAVKYSPDVVSYRMYLAQICSQNSKLRKEAEEHLLYVIKLEPQNIDAHILLGTLYQQGGLIKSARTQFEEVLKIQPNNRIASQHLGIKTFKTPPGGVKFPKIDTPNTLAQNTEKNKPGFFSKLFKR